MTDKELDNMIEEIEFAKDVCPQLNPYWCISLDVLNTILSKYIPNYFTKFKEEV